ncbi:MAG: nucleotidyltransferase family protein [Armatimonadota bacterium]
MPLQIDVNHERIAEFCRKHHISKLAFFGSVLRDDFRPDSDVDVLVWFQPEQTPGLLRLMAMQHELTDLIGRQVDLRTPDELSRHFRDEVVTEAEVQYAA